MTPKLEEQLVRQEEQNLALLAAILWTSREVSFGRRINTAGQEIEAKTCVEIAALIQQSARNHMA